MLPTSGDQGGPVLPGTGKSARLGRVLQGEGTPTCHSSGQGPLPPQRRAPRAWPGLPGVEALWKGSWADAAWREGTSKAPLIPSDIFRHRSLLFYAVDQSPKLYE